MNDKNIYSGRYGNAGSIGTDWLDHNLTTSLQYPMSNL